MAKIRITQKQAMMLENLNKPKKIKITEAQYKAILKYEGLDENAVIPQIANSISKVDAKAGKDYRQNVNTIAKPGLFKESEGLWKEFVNELYGLNESGNNLYEKLIKLMEACGYVENRKLSKSKFGGDKNKAKDVIISGLNKLQECGSPYMAMESMEDAYNNITENSYDDDRTKAYLAKQFDRTGAPASDEEMSNVMSALQADAAKSGIKEEGDEGMNTQNAIIGMDILNYEPFKSLADTRAEAGDYTVRLEPTLPSLEIADANVKMLSKKDFTDYSFQGPKMMHNHVGYITQFKNKFGEEPMFINLTPGRFGRAEIANEKFLDWKNGGIENKRAYMDSQRNQGMTSGLDEAGVDETTSMGGAGAVFGNQGGDYPVGKLASEEKIYEALNALKKKVDEESDEALEEATMATSSGQYATAGFAKSKFMGTAGKKGKAPVNMKKKTPIWPGGTIVGESATDKTQWAGGAFVEFDDCTKLNNNKDAQNGGCSTGSIDNVVKLKKTASNVNAPSLGKKQGE